MKLDPLLQPLAELAPEWANWLCFTKRSGFAFWQDSIDPASVVWGFDGIRYSDDGLPMSIRKLSGTAINLRSGSIFIRRNKKVIEVSQSEWSGMP